MKTRYLIVLIPVVLALLLTACSPRSAYEYYAGTWVIGEHPLRYVERTDRLQGNLSGGLFFMRGSLSTEPTLTFAWEPQEGKVVITTLPLSKFVFQIDETRDIPTVEFIFNRDYALTDQISVNDPLPEEAREGNPNDYLMGRGGLLGGLKMINVRISEETLNKEIYLPK